MELASQIENLRRRLQRRRLLAAACWTITILVATAILLIACDRLLSMEDFWGRTFLAAALACVCLLVVRHVWRLSQPIDSHKVALRIERRHPKLRDKVTSALAFSRQAPNDPFAGSEALRRAVVIQTSVELKGLDWQQFVPRRPLRRAMSAAATALLAISIISWWAPPQIPPTKGRDLSRIHPQKRSKRSNPQLPSKNTNPRTQNQPHRNLRRNRPARHHRKRRPRHPRHQARLPSFRSPPAARPNHFAVPRKQTPKPQATAGQLPLATRVARAPPRSRSRNPRPSKRLPTVNR